MPTIEQLKRISNENTHKKEELSTEVFEKLVAAAEDGEFVALVKITKDKDIEILENQGFTVYRAYHKTNLYMVGWED